MSALSVLQNYFRPLNEERRSKLSAEQRILIQDTAVSDSIIARFGSSSARWPTFATQSGAKWTSGGGASMSSPGTMQWSF
jgi:hypothetical protein